MNRAIQSAAEAGALQSARDARAPDPIGEAIGEVIDARHAIDDVLQRAQARLEIVERENVELRKQLVEAKFEWFTKQEFAERLQCSVDQIDRLLAKKRLPCVQLGPRLKRFTTAHLVEWAKVLEVQPKLELAKPRRKAA